MKRQNWTCPFCNRPSTIGAADTDFVSGENRTESADGYRVMKGRFTVCPNPDCRKLSFKIALHKATMSSRGYLGETSEVTNYWNLIPDSVKKVYSPEIVPQAVINDYEEACKIKNLSPKASATLARRALQGMIRDFWGVKGKPTLKQEIEAIEDKVDSEVWAAIDAVRDVGNIGAHMERDVNIIIDVEPGEADKLIELIELLIEEWYINRHERQARLAAIQKMAAGKKAQKAAAKSTSKTSMK